MNLKKLAIFIFTTFFTLNTFAAATRGYSLKRHNILVEYVPQNYGVLLYYVDLEGKKTPVLDTINFGISSFTGVVIDQNYYNLKTSGDVTGVPELTERTLAITYNIAKKITLKITYSVPKKNILNVQYEIKSIDGVRHNVGVKSIYDTCLGEWNGVSMFTEAKSKIDSEYIINDFTNHKALTSTDGATRIKFFMDKDFGKNAYKAVIASKTFFETDSFESSFTEGRSFNTVLNYNNSSVGFFFKSRVIDKNKSAKFNQQIEFFQFKIAPKKTVADDNMDKRIQRYEEDEEATNEITEEYEFDIENEVIESNEELANKSEEIIKESHNQEVTLREDKKDEETSFKEEIISDNREIQPPMPGPTLPDEERGAIEQNAENSTSQTSSNAEALSPTPVEQTSTVEAETVQVKKTVDKERAMEIINRIQSLEDDGTNTNRVEIIQLQAELNQILKELEEAR